MYLQPESGVEPDLENDPHDMTLCTVRILSPRKAMLTFMLATLKLVKWEFLLFCRMDKRSVLKTSL